MRIIWALFMVSVVSGCSSLAVQLSRGPVPVTVSEIRHAIACEFVYALQRTKGDGHAFLEAAQAVVELKLGVKDTLKFTPGLGEITAKAGDATLKATASSVVLDNQLQDNNVIAYAVSLKKQANEPNCPEQHSATAASGLGLAEFLQGTAEVIDAGGKIFPPTGLGTAKLETVLNTGVSDDTIPAIKYTRKFQVKHTAKGGLSFEMSAVKLTLTGDASERDRALAENVITVLVGGKDEGDQTLSDAILQQRQALQNDPSRLQPQVVIVQQAP